MTTTNREPMKLSGEVKAILSDVLSDYSDYLPSYSTKLMERYDSLDKKDDKDALTLIYTIVRNWYDFEQNNPYDSLSLQPDDLNRLKEMVTNIEQPLLLAYIFDILWANRNEYEYARKAIEAYQEIYKRNIDTEQWSSPFKFLKRAYKIANVLFARDKKDPAYTELYAYIATLITTLDGTDPSFLSVNLIEMLLPNAPKDNIVKFLKITNKIIDAACLENNLHKIEVSYELKLELIKKLGDNFAKIDTFADYANAIKNQAVLHQDDAVPFRAIHIYEKAIQLFRKAKQEDSANEILRIIEPLKKAQYDSMHVASHELDISIETSCVRKLIEKRSLKEQILLMCLLTGFDNIEQIENRVLQKNIGFISSMFSTNILDREGRTILYVKPLDLRNPKADVELLKTHMHLDALEYQGYYGAISIGTALDIIKKEHQSIDVGELNFIIEDNILINKDRAHIFKLGIYYGLTGDFYTSLHLLAPQMENFFRELAKLCGGIVMDFSNDGIEKAKVLSSVFSTPELIECYDESILFTFEGLLNKVAGANIRNKIGHGIMDSDEGNGSVAKYFFAAVVKLLSLYSNECKSIYREISSDFKDAMHQLQVDRASQESALQFKEEG